MKKTIVLLLLIVSLQSSAQIKEASLQASGLTCSMCSKAIYKSLVAVPFVKDVASDIKNSIYTITFKEGEEVDIDALKKAVTNAGFSVARFRISVAFNKEEVSNDAHIKLAGKTFHFMDVKDQVLEGDRVLTVIDKNFLTAKEYKNYSKFTSMKCYGTGRMESCCSKKEGQSAAERIYHVTI